MQSYKLEKHCFPGAQPWLNIGELQPLRAQRESSRGPLLVAVDDDRWGHRPRPIDRCVRREGGGQNDDSLHAAGKWVNMDGQGEREGEREGGQGAICIRGATVLACMGMIQLDCITLSFFY